MSFAPSASQQAVESAFAALYGTVPHSLVDIGHREVGIEIEGTLATLALSSAIAFDIEAMPVNSGCRTIFDERAIRMPGRESLMARGGLKAKASGSNFYRGAGGGHRIERNLPTTMSFPGKNP